MQASKRAHQTLGTFLLCISWLTASGAQPLVGDFDGDGYTDHGVWDAARVRALLDSTNDGRIDGIAPGLGASSDQPFMGDWDGDGVETLALYRQSTNQIIWCNSNSTGAFSVRTVNAVGVAGGIPVKGDWDSNGQDGFAIYDRATRTFVFYQSMASASFASQNVGDPGDLPVSGDWNADGDDSIGIFRPSTREFWLYDALSGAPTVHVGSIGNPGDLPLAGRWHGFPSTVLGLYRPSTAQFIHFDLNAANFQAVSWLDPISVVETDGRQVFYTSGAPHTNASGTVRTAYNSSDSFLPLGIYGIWSTYTESGPGPGNGIFPVLQAAGFNVAMTWPTITVPEALQAAAGYNVKVIPRFMSPGDFLSHDPEPGLFAWYVNDEPKRCEDPPVEPVEDCELTRTQEWFAEYGSQAIHPLFNTIGGGTPSPFLEELAQLGKVLAIDEYPIRRPPDSPATVESIATEVTRLRTAPAASGKPLWFVPQAFKTNCEFSNPVPASCQPYWQMPLTNPDHYRSMVYTAFVHGATGLMSFAWDSILMRQSGNLGISPQPVQNYSNCIRDGAPCHTPSLADLAKSQDLWNRVVALNTELSAMKAPLLSPTSSANYTIDLLQAPNNTVASPIRALLKTSPNGTYLIAVNLINDNLDAVFQLQSPVTSVTVQFENRAIATPLSAIRDHFGPFAVHVYKW
jgi:hypothetical protein